MLKEDLHDAGEIIQNIFTQPLSVPGAKKDISLLDAARSFDPQNAMASDFRKIILSFLQFPEQTETMLRELEILEDELK